jgi:hypothetical protein
MEHHVKDPTKEFVENHPPPANFHQPLIEDLSMQ